MASYGAVHRLEEIQRIRAQAERSRNKSCNLLGHTAGIPEINQFPKPLNIQEPILGKELPAVSDLYFFDVTFPEMCLEEWCGNPFELPSLARQDQR